jgi:FMN phosphatase YigB (HAD superfamily)
VTGADSLVRCRAVALDFGGTISTDREDHVIGQKGVDPRAAAALHELAGLGIRLLLATNATAAETRWPALQLAGVHELFAVALVSYSLNVRKDEPLFYDLVVTAAQCPAGEVLFVGDRIDYDVAAPMRAGMQACLVRPGGLRSGEQLPDGALMIGHVHELVALVATG